MCGVPALNRFHNRGDALASSDTCRGEASRFSAAAELEARKERLEAELASLRDNGGWALQGLAHWSDRIGGQLRKERNWTQQQLAKGSGVQQSEISRIERGQANPTFRTLQQIAQAVKKTISFVDVAPGTPA